MSGIAGVSHLDGRPCDPALVASLASTLAHRGGDNLGIWCDGAVGLACQLLRVTPESTCERQPVTDDANRVLVFDGRLDNRDAIIAAMAPGDRWRGSPDSAVVLAAFDLWGRDALGQLIGDFALALFDAGDRSVVLARDPVGCRPLYYWTDGTTFVFASEIKAILAYPGVPAKPNDDLLADAFLLNQLPYDDHRETYFDGVYAVRPGWWLRASRDIQTGRFWDFDPSAQLRCGSPPEYAERFRELIVQAVRRRLRSVHPVAVATSGGLDSSIVLACAADASERGANAAPLIPLTYTGVHDQSAEENDFIALLETARRLHVRRIPIGEPGGVEQAMHGAWQSEAPFLDDGWYAQQPMVASGRALGARVLLTGLWSDQLLFETSYLVDLFKSLAWRQVMRHLHEYPRWFVDAEPAYFRLRFCRELLLNFTPRAGRAAVRAIRATRPIALKSRHASVARREWAERLSRRRYRLQRPHGATTHARCVYEMVRALSHRLQFESDEKQIASYGMEMASPFLDRDVIAFLMSIPGEAVNREGVPRMILRDAAREIVPDPILQRRWRDDSAVGAERRAQWLTCLSPAARLPACRERGWVRDDAIADGDAFEFLGLECWSRRFFASEVSSGKLIDSWSCR